MERILYVTHQLQREAGSANAYFRERARRYFLFSMCPTVISEPSVFETYEDGRLLSVREYRWHVGLPLVAKYAALYLEFMHAVLTGADRGTTIITFHPLFCVGNSLLRLVKGTRTVYWMFDRFDRHDGLYRWFNALVDFHVRRLPAVVFLTEAMRKDYASRIPRRDGAHWTVTGLGVREMALDRHPEDGVIGFIGNLKEGQGLEALIDCLKTDETLRLEIVGVGTSQGALAKRARAAGVADRVRFLGIITDDERLADVSSRWQIAAAPYEQGDYLSYTDPGKIKLYLQLGLPILTTTATPGHDAIDDARAGVATAPDAASLQDGIRRMRTDAPLFSAGVSRLRSEYEYRRMYDSAFGFLG